MKLLIILSLITSPIALIAQDKKVYEPIDKIGWELPDVWGPDGLTEHETGTVNYLLTISAKGRIKGIKVLTSTFAPEVERKLRDDVKKLTLIRMPDRAGKIRHQGTLEISAISCIDDASKENAR